MVMLTTPGLNWHSAWLEAHAEWGSGLHEDGFGLLPSDDVLSSTGFTTWMDRLAKDEHCTYWWITDESQVLGGIALRHPSHPLIPRHGHLGYGIRPSARGRGLATWAIAQVVEHASNLGMDQVLAVCEIDNKASARTLEHHGATLEKSPSKEPVLRYRIQTNPLRE